MKTITASNASKNFGGYIDAARREPVVVTRQNRPVAVTFSIEEAEMLLRGRMDGYFADTLKKQGEGEQSGSDLLKSIHDMLAQIGGADDLVEAMKDFPSQKIGDPISFSE